MAQKYIPGQIIIAFKDSALGEAPAPGPALPPAAAGVRPLVRRALLLLANVRFDFAATRVDTMFRVAKRVVEPTDPPAGGGPLTPALSDFIAFAQAATPPKPQLDAHANVRAICRKYIRVIMPESNVRAALEYVRKYPSLIEYAERVPARYFLPLAAANQGGGGADNGDPEPPGEDTVVSTPWSHSRVGWVESTRKQWESAGAPNVRNIAVLDSGFDEKHLGLQGLVKSGNSDANVDPWGHGTAVASIICSHAGTFHNKYMRGGFLPAAKTKLLMYKVSAEGTPVTGITFPVDFDLYMTVIAHLTECRAANRAAEHASGEFHIRVVNMSFGGPECSFTETALLRKAHEAGLHLVACAGNRDGAADDSTRTWFPAALTTVTSVGALQQQGKRWEKSKYSHPYREGKVAVDLTAPGTSIEGAWPVTGASLIHNSKLSAFQASIWLDGSSFAAPFVTAAAALLFEKEKSNAPKGKDIHDKLRGAYAQDANEEGTGAGVLNVSNLKP
ncbi:MAG: S8 family serine peptidase [Bryobacterales bacterium]|nr:S8 family serine peptidase [Bryobacterales bacterium]